ncbi:PDR/VanB family oxidoreductase [Marisediminicola senii]|uniref:PDR/VanB family oxidoreductase n=1 Tax=Marisediminicola senii TaxID=2711233 RepID=UPI0013E9C267|nr:PDR/VanB family oxidoreductase [Marisediminicola senii]
MTWTSQALTLMVLLGISAASPPGELKLATAEVAELLDLKILGTSAITAAFTGFGLAAVTTWGYFHHWWVSTKFVLTIVQILIGSLLIAEALPVIVDAARAGTDGPVVFYTVVLGLMTVGLSFQVWLSVAKPFGRTAMGEQAKQRGSGGHLSTAPAAVIAAVFVAALLDIVPSALLSIPLPILSLPTLTVALVLRQRHNRRGAADSAADRGDGVTTGVIPSVVLRRVDSATEVVSLRLTTTDGSTLPSWEPGAHIDLRLASGKVRQYSLHGDPSDRSAYDISVLRESAGLGASIEIHNLQEGSPVKIGGPRNNFPLVEAPSYLFIAGGIGITALKPMIERLDAAGADWRLIYRGKTRRGMLCADDFDAKYPTRVRVLPADTSPRPDLSEQLRSVPPGGAVYCCGPQQLMDAVSEAMVTACPQGTLYLERFTATVKDDSQNRAFQVVLPSTSTVVDVPAESTMLESLRGVLPDSPASCETGVCGSCEMRVLAGRPEHRDDILTGTARERTDIVYPCVSRSRDPLLVLDA